VQMSKGTSCGHSSTILNGPVVTQRDLGSYMSISGPRKDP
jgi:hypothetical protein